MENTVETIPKFNYFNGFERLYIARLQHMFPSPRVLKCPNISVQNHLLGQCALCGTGNLSTTRKTRISIVALDRLYPVYGVGTLMAPALQLVKKLYPNFVTNLEFPIPVIRYGNFVNIPLAFDVATETVIDVCTTQGYKHSRALKVCREHKFNYLLLSNEGDIVVDARNQYVKDPKIAALKKILKEILE